MKSTLVMIFVLSGLIRAQGVWTDVLNSPGQPSAANGTYWKIGSATQPAQVQNTSLAAIGYMLVLPISSLTGANDQTGSNMCGVVDGPVTFIESNKGYGMKGLGFLGSFNAPIGGVPLTYQPGQNLFEAVFFHEDPCYGGTLGSTSREYGFFLAGSNSSIWVYWGTHENQANQVQAQLQLTRVQPKVQYYFSMYPTGNATNCGFQVYVLDTSFNTIYPLTYIPVDSYNYGGSITTADPGFCSALTADGGVSGYVSANILAQPQVSGTLPPPSDLSVNLQRVYVGK